MQVAVKCRSQGARVFTEILDVCHQSLMDQWIRSVGSIDLVLACAGISAMPCSEKHEHVMPEPVSQVRQIMQTNVQGVLNTVLPALEVMRKQDPDSENIRGRIAAIASIAGFFTSAWAPAYCASKAAIDRFMVASGAGWRTQGIVLSSICCGFVATPMTDKNRFYMPGKLSADQAARLILQGIGKGKRRVVFPAWLAIMARVVDLFPASIIERLYLPYLESQEQKNKEFRNF